MFNVFDFGFDTRIKTISLLTNIIAWSMTLALFDAVNSCTWLAGIYWMVPLSMTLS